MGGEAFPVYEIHKDGFQEIEIDEETLKKWKHVFNEFENMQKDIIQALEDHGHEAWARGAYNGFQLDDE